MTLNEITEKLRAEFMDNNVVIDVRYKINSEGQHEFHSVAFRQADEYYDEAFVTFNPNTGMFSVYALSASDTADDQLMTMLGLPSNFGDA